VDLHCFNVDQDPALNINADPDPGSPTNAVLDPDPGQTFRSHKVEFLNEKYTSIRQ
jgi:hypothetical protein